jgi:hypothetical protein
LHTPRLMVRSPHAKAFIAAIAFLGVAELLAGALQWQTNDLRRFICYFAIALASSLLKVKLPGITGTVSLNFLFVLVGIVELSVSETVIMASAATLVQCLWRPKERPRFGQVLFNVTNVIIAVSLAGVFYRAHSYRDRNSASLLCWRW